VTLNYVWRRDRKLLPVILKQMDSHESSNSKTALIFIITVAFLLYASSNFAAIFTLTIKYSMSMVGSEEAVVAIPLGFMDFGSGSLKIQNVDREGLHQFLLEEKAKGTILESTLVSSTMDSQTLFGEDLPEMTIRLGSVSPVDVNIYGLQETYTRSVYKEYIMVEDILDGYEPQQVVDALFDLERKQSAAFPRLDDQCIVSRSADQHLFQGEY